MKKCNRKIGYDILRIFACFGVIINHSILIYDQYGMIPNWKWIIVNAIFCLCKTAVTIYLLLSAALLLKKEEDYKTWFFKRILRMCLILLVWSVVYINTNNGVSGNSLLVTIFSSIEKEASLHLWYLYMFIGICIMLPFLRKMVSQMSKKDWNVFIIIWLVFGGFIPYYNAFTPQYPLLLSPYFSVGFLSGYVAIYIIGYKIDSLEINKRRFFVSIILFLTSWTVNVIGTYYMSVKNQFAARNFDSPIILPVVLSACAILYISKYVNEYFSEKTCKIFTLIAELSKCTLGIYLVHPLILNWIWSQNTNLLYIKFFSHYTIFIHQFLFLNIIVFVISAIVVYIIRKIPILKIII